MRKFAIAVAAVVGLVAGPAAARGVADTGSAELSRCVVLKITQLDRPVLARWIVGAMASTPESAGIAKVDSVALNGADQGVATLLTRLLLVDCPDISNDRSPSHEGIRVSVILRVLAEIAIHDLTGSIGFAVEVGTPAQYIDFRKLKQ